MRCPASLTGDRELSYVTMASAEPTSWASVTRCLPARTEVKLYLSRASWLVLVLIVSSDIPLCLGWDHLNYLSIMIISCQPLEVLPSYHI